MGVGEKDKKRKVKNKKIPVNKKQKKSVIAEGIGSSIDKNGNRSHVRVFFVIDSSALLSTGFPCKDVSESRCALTGNRSQNLLLQTHGRVTTELTGVTSRAIAARDCHCIAERCCVGAQFYFLIYKPNIDRTTDRQHKKEQKNKRTNDRQPRN
jgi:hypothetical protein